MSDTFFFLLAQRLKLIKEQKAKAMMDEVREEVKQPPPVEFKPGQKGVAFYGESLLGGHRHAMH